MGQHLDSDSGLALNLSQGSLTRSGVGRVLPIPESLFDGLASGLSEDGLRSWGRGWGAMVGVSLAGQAEQTRSAQWVVGTLAREFALWGLGHPSLEQWGRALVVALKQPVGQLAGQPLLEGVVEGALRSAFARPQLEVVAVEGGGQQTPELLRLLVCGPRAAERVRRARNEGAGWGEILVDLNRGASGDASDASSKEEAN